MDPKKTEAVTKFPRPTIVKSLQRSFGMATFSLRFIPNMATMTTPLRHLLQKGSKFEWTTECQNNFIQLKDTLHQTGQLAHPDFSCPFLLQTDTLNHGLGAVILQVYTIGAERLIAYISRSLTPTEKNCSKTKKEWLAIVWAFTKFHPYLHGTHVKVETDHQPSNSSNKQDIPTRSPIKMGNGFTEISVPINL